MSADNKIIAVISVQISRTGHGDPRFSPNGFSGEDRVGVRKRQASKARTEDDICPARHVTIHVAERSANGNITVAIPVHVSCCNALARIIQDALSGECDIGIVQCQHLCRERPEKNIRTAR